MKLEMRSEAMEIKMEINPGKGYEGDPYGYDLLARAIVHLVEMFDTHSVEKEVGHGGAQQYYAAVLSAVARHYMMEDFGEREILVRDALTELITGLVKSGMLQEIISSGLDDYELE